MNILIAANTTWYIHNFRDRLIVALIEQGHRVTVLAPRDGYVSRVESLGARHVHLDLNNTGTNPLREIPTLLNLATLLRREHPDLLLSYTPKINIYASLAAWWSNIPVIANISGLGRGFISGSVVRIVMLCLYRFALRHAHTVFFQNDDDRSEFLYMGLVVPGKAVLLPGSGVDLERFSPVSRSSGKNLVFLMVARLLWDKGVKEYVQAARLVKSDHPEVEFRLLGALEEPDSSAVQRSELECWHKEGIVHYLGSTDEILPFYAAADCVVLPSYREGTPRTLLEAASTGLPLIASDAVGCRDVVDHGVNGLLCRTRDAHDLAAQMEQIISMSPQERAEMGAAGRTKMEREYDERIVIERYLDVIRKIGDELRSVPDGAKTT